MTPVDTPQRHPLQTGWSFYLHYAAFGDSYTAETAFDAVATVRTVPDFWRYFTHIPPPSQLLADEHGTRREIDGRVIEGVGLFREAVAPKWEDPIHAQGGHWQCRSTFQPGVLDAVWEELAMGVIGETSDVSADVTGIRIVDKSRGRGCVSRLEVWCSTMPAQTVLTDLTSWLPKSCRHLKWVWQDHGKSISMWNNG
jgi:translation initiation factor 4E